MRPPTLEAVEPKGAGDSYTAAMAAAVAHGRTMVEALTLGAAASALNVTRRGLASGRQALIERLAALVTVEDDGEGVVSEDPVNLRRARVKNT